MAGSAKAPEKVVGAELSSSPGADDGWRCVAEQIDSLRAVLLNQLPCGTKTPSWAGAQLEYAILAAPRGARAREPGSGVDSSTGRSHRLPHMKEFSVGGDWSAFTWRFESAFRSIRWTKEEALDALPTLLDDISLAVFRSMPAEKKTTLREAFAEMAEIYEPPLDTQRKFVQR
ncbi:unnamed protein product [Lampetra fluviatilis]